MKCAPTKQDDLLSKLRFNSRIHFQDELYCNKNLKLRLSELTMGKLQQLVVGKDEAKNIKASTYSFDCFEFTSDVFKSQAQLA